MSLVKPKAKLMPVMPEDVSDFFIRSFLDTLKDELHDILITRDDLSPFARAASLHLLNRCAKKAEINDEADRLHFEAITKFLEVNQRAREVTVSLPSDVASDARDFIHHALSMAASNLARRADRPYEGECLSVCDIFTDWRFGPGSTRGTTGNATHFADKVVQLRPTVTAQCETLASIMRKLNPHLFRFDTEENVKFKLVFGSSMSTVPKNETTFRTTCGEPDMNMAVQLSAARQIELALSLVGNAIDTQEPKNKKLAQIGSITNQLCTIDLQSASDLITPALIRELWPAEWFSLLYTIRSPYTSASLAREGGDRFDVQLHMMSTMGCGFTFPMMTLTLLALVYACQPSGRRFYVDYSKIGVYGDDIICPLNMYEKVCEVLGQAGLVVNRDKSFSQGPFRESCGGDFWRGYDVTPFYTKSLRQDADVYVAMNQLVRWSCIHDLYLPRSFKLLRSLLFDADLVLVVPASLPPTSGVLASGSFFGVGASRRPRVRCLVGVASSVRRPVVPSSLLPLLYVGGYATQVLKCKRCRHVCVPGSPERFVRCERHKEGDMEFVWKYTRRTFLGRYVCKQIRVPEWVAVDPEGLNPQELDRVVEYYLDA